MPQAWTQEQRDDWFKTLKIKPHRDYTLTIIPRIEALKGREGIEVETYGSVTYEYNDDQGEVYTRTHDLYLIRVGDFDSEKPTHVITGGTHGYEKGGVEAALSFAEKEALNYTDTHNVLIYPCMCPGPYEVEHRFTQGAIDPNRDALLDGAQSPEMQAFVNSIQEQHQKLFGDDSTGKFNRSADLHETPLLDKTVILEMMENLQGETFDIDEKFPEGMFLITSAESNLALVQSIVRRVQADGYPIVEDDKLYGEPNLEGVLLHQLEGTVESLMSKFTVMSLTTESCGLHIHDEMPDDARAADQLSVIRALFSEPDVS